MHRIRDILHGGKRDSVAILKVHLKSIVARRVYRDKMTNRATLHENGNTDIQWKRMHLSCVMQRAGLLKMLIWWRLWHFSSYPSFRACVTVWSSRVQALLTGEGHFISCVIQVRRMLYLVWDTVSCIAAKIKPPATKTGVPGWRNCIYRANSKVWLARQKQYIVNLNCYL